MMMIAAICLFAIALLALLVWLWSLQVEVDKLNSKIVVDGLNAGLLADLERRLTEKIKHQVNKERSDTTLKVQHLASLAPDTKLKMIVETDGSRSKGQDVPKTVEWHLQQLATMSHEKYMVCAQNCRYEIVKE